jgi:hypothetical protein
MYQTNFAIRKYLIENGFYNIHIIPHTRFSKDLLLDGVGFDAVACKKYEKRLFLLQFKTNLKPSKKILDKYRKLSKKYSIRCLWITKIKRKGIEVFE